MRSQLGGLLAPFACALACVLALPSGAFAATSNANQASGTITNVQWSSFTIQTAGKQTGMISALTMTADAITKDDYPYVWGGGHAEAGIASVGDKGGPGANGRTLGFDCSGSVAAVLAGAGLWPAGSPVPADNGVISELLADHVIARGPGQAPNEVTLYDDPGVHIFMNIDGRFFGTSDGGGGGDRKGGAGWLYDGAPDASSKAYKQYHVLPSVLKDSTTYGQSYTFQLGQNSGLIQGFEPGDKVTVGYHGTAGEMVARTVAYVGAQTATGTLTAIAAGGSSFTLQTAAGKTYTFAIGQAGNVLGNAQINDTVTVIYTKSAGVLTAHILTVTGTPSATVVSGTITAISANQATFMIQTVGGQSMTFSTADNTGVLGSLQVGASLQVTYLQLADGLLAAQQVAATGTPSSTGGAGSGTGTTGSGSGTGSGPGTGSGSGGTGAGGGYGSGGYGGGGGY
jgi:hypothetical protein